MGQPDHWRVRGRNPDDDRRARRRRREDAHHLGPDAQDAARRTGKRTAPGQTRRVFAVSRRSEEHTSELQSLMRISYAVFCLKKKKNNETTPITTRNNKSTQRLQHIKQQSSTTTNH